MTVPKVQNALLIHNPSAGNGGTRRRALLDQARRLFSLAGIHTDFAETKAPGHATQMARQAAEDRRDLLIACGGDGTLNEIVNGLTGGPDAKHNGDPVPLALLPGGTANVLAKEINLPWDIPTAAEKLCHGQFKEIALGLATPLKEPQKKKYFLSVAGAGPDGMMVYSINVGLKARVGILAYWWQGMRAVFHYKFPHFHVRVAHVTAGSDPAAASAGLKASLVVIGRTKHYGGPFRITDQADLYANEFEVMALTTQSGFRYLSYLPALWMGKLRGSSGVHYYKSGMIRCEPLDENPVYAQIDGEPLARLPVEFTIVPRALKLLVPSDSLTPKTAFSA